jgi:hypothetical protein
MHTPQHNPLENPKTPFSHSVKEETIDAIKASAGSSD